MHHVLPLVARAGVPAIKAQGSYLTRNMRFRQCPTGCARPSHTMINLRA